MRFVSDPLLIHERLHKPSEVKERIQYNAKCIGQISRWLTTSIIILTYKFCVIISIHWLSWCNNSFFSLNYGAVTFFSLSKHHRKQLSPPICVGYWNIIGNSISVVTFSHISLWTSWQLIHIEYCTIHDVSFLVIHTIFCTSPCFYKITSRAL